TGLEILPSESDEPRYPVIILTGHGDERVAVEAMKTGALDYVVKSEATLAELPYRVERVLREWNLMVLRKHTEHSLRESEELNRRILEAVPGGIVRVSVEGGILFANAEAQRILGLSYDERTASYVEEEDLMILREDGSPCPDEEHPVHRCLQTGTPHPPVTMGVRRRGGMLTWAVFTAVPTLDPHTGQLTGAVATFLDVTERKRAEDTARQAQQQLLRQQQREKKHVETQLDKAKSQLVRQTRLATIGQIAASIAHELRNPLGAVRNAAYYLHRRIPAEDATWEEYLDIIEQEVGTADQIISNLMEMSRAKDPVKQRVELSRVVHDAFGRVKHTHEVKLVCAFEPGACVVLADPGQLQQVLGNLLTNAVQAMGAGGHIKIEARQEAAFDMIRVVDDGPGVNAGIRHRIFEPLYTTKAKGTGLGLAICRQIIERHGGRLDLEEADAPGAVFCIRLPRFHAEADLS
ncbi:MAG: ATP-binding protein, partial [Rhodothermales bacterium]